ncbi:MAG TPA: ATP-binding cassette domain-containing protein [Gammaproteobacteria bacterium]|nr:ATP-binding cassette domain-containing protein [Gammaproteobacteria bacterium]
MIEINQLKKVYGSLVAVDGVSFTVSPGEVLGFLGPNGAGKSTTMKMITGFVSPTSGSARVCGFDVDEAPIEAKRRIGYLPEGAPGYGEMTPRRFLDFIAAVRGLEPARKRERLDAVIAELHLGPVLDQSIETLSKGFRRRVGLAQAILHDPQVLILDEPTDGLDPNQKHEVRALINSMAQDKIIVISTHILEEVEAVCSRAIIIADGRIVADDTPQALEARSRFHNAVSLRLADPSRLGPARAAIAALPQVAGTELDAAGERLTAFPKDGALVLPAVSELAARERWEVLELHLESGRLDEVFRDITGGIH